ncbi:endonuclease domain-containing protein [Rhodococcus sp. NPDC077669]|uniref:endonuclease domain-containing protein n=1 Tax=Rhodococcus sp. NPDC077669 TaxID=3155174 RepID=UPI003446CB15
MQQRCYAGTTRLEWPATLGSSALGRVRRTLLDALGHACHACGGGLATVVDHDHVTGQIRGLICRYCNENVDNCGHVRDCRWADYLNYPPTLRVGIDIKYPDRSRDRKHREVRVSLLGFDPFPPEGDAVAN